MARPQRNDPVPTPAPLLPGSPPHLSPQHLLPWSDGAGQGYQPGGQVGQMQADLARRLSHGFADETVAASPTERAVRLLSMAGGYGALLAGYVGIAALIFR